MKKNIAKLLSALASLLMLFSLVVCVLFVYMSMSQKVPSVMGYSALRLISGSMEPTYPVGTVVLVKKVDPAGLKVGDVISFYSRDPMISGIPNTHRIANINSKDSKLNFVTHGDANMVEDPYLVEPEDVIGVVVGKASALEVVSNIMSNQYVFFGVIILPLLAIVAVEIKKILFFSTKNDKDGQP